MKGPVLAVINTIMEATIPPLGRLRRDFHRVCQVGPGASSALTRVSGEPDDTRTSTIFTLMRAAGVTLRSTISQYQIDGGASSTPGFRKTLAEFNKR
jgi:hypothetical protein